MEAVAYGLKAAVCMALTDACMALVLACRTERSVLRNPDARMVTTELHWYKLAVLVRSNTTVVVQNSQKIFGQVRLHAADRAVADDPARVAAPSQAVLVQSAHLLAQKQGQSALAGSLVRVCRRN
jgi:hypothetical protein